MADATTTEDTIDEQADKAARLLDDPDGPRALLAFALARLDAADATMDEAEKVGDSGLDALEYAMFGVEVANALRGIAETAHLLQASGGHVRLDDEPAESDEGHDTHNTADDHPQDEVPQAVRGIRFTARYVGHDMGTAVWVPRLAAFVPKLGYIETAATDGDRAVDPACDVVLVASGRVVSATSVEAMVITDRGHTLALLRGVGDYEEMPDE